MQKGRGQVVDEHSADGAAGKTCLSNMQDMLPATRLLPAARLIDCRQENMTNMMPAAQNYKNDNTKPNIYCVFLLSSYRYLNNQQCDYVKTYLSKICPGNKAQLLLNHCNDTDIY